MLTHSFVERGKGKVDKEIFLNFLAWKLLYKYGKSIKKL